MFRTLFKVALLLIVGLLGYNYFYGTVEEKEQSRVIVGKVKDLGADAWNLLRSERTKMKEGKYDGALDRLDALYTDLRETAGDLGDSELLRQISELSERRHELEETLGTGDELSRSAQRKLDELTADTEALMHEMETKSQPPAPY